MSTIPQQRIERYKTDLDALNAQWQPHPGQARVLQNFFTSPTKKLLFIPAGGNFGKSSICNYIAWYFAALFDNQSVFYIGAEKKQQKEIIWEPQGGGLSIKEFGGPHFRRTYNETELRIEFPDTKSFIKVDGSDNSESYRGIAYDLMIFDEWKDHRYQFYQAVYPRRFKKPNAKIVIIGTPPEAEDNHFVTHYEQIKEDEDWAIIQGTCWDNPYLNHEELQKEKIKYYKRGDGSLWEREYEGKFVFGGSKTIFPMWDDAKHFKRHDALMQMLERDRGKLKWFTISDPGSTSCFAVLFGAYNPYTSQVYILDEIYEKDHLKTSTVQIFGRTKAIEQNLYPNHEKKSFVRVYDEAAAWYANEVQYNFKTSMFPSRKAMIDKNSQISLIKDMLMNDMVFVSDRCVNFRTEVKNYKTDDKGRVPKGNDHLIDDMRYMLAHFNYRFIEGVERIQTKVEARTPAQAIAQLQTENDWTSFADDPFLH